MSSANKKTLLIFGITVTALLAAAAALAIWNGGAEAAPASAPVPIPVSAADWGLSFPADGQPPVGNATSDDTLHALTGGIDHVLVGDEFVEIAHSLARCRGDKGSCEYLAHLIGGDILLLASLECERGRREGSAYKHHEHDDIDDCISVALLIHVVYVYCR